MNNKDKEVWRDIPIECLDGRYEVSNKYRVRDKKTGRILIYIYKKKYKAEPYVNMYKRDITKRHNIQAVTRRVYVLKRMAFSEGEYANVGGEWRDIDGFEGTYQVSSLGYVKNIIKGTLLKSEISKFGYVRVRLTKDGKSKQYSIHRLVAAAFISNPNNYPQVNHINEIKTDNYVSNLEWCTAKYNMNYSSKAEREKRSQERLSA